MGDAVRQIVPKPLQADTWAPFGWLPVDDTDPADGSHILEFAWGDVHVNRIGHRRDEVTELPQGLRCEVLFRHATHTQVLMSLDNRAVVVVAPAELSMTGRGDIDQVRAFLLDPLSSVVLHRGTWHWGPYPVDGEAVTLFNVQGRRYIEDNASVDLAAAGVPLDVILDG
ncbi:MAG TPA: ureidoglycolate lyase [Acidimicrobiales bacterium]